MEAAAEFYEKSLEQLRSLRIRKQALLKQADGLTPSARFWYPLLRGSASVASGLATLLCAMALVLESDIDRVRLLALAMLFPFAAALASLLRAPDRWCGVLLGLCYFVAILGFVALAMTAGLTNAASSLVGGSAGASLLAMFCTIASAAHYNDRELRGRIDAVVGDDLLHAYERRLREAQSIVKIDAATRSPERIAEMRNNLANLERDIREFEERSTVIIHY